MGLFGWMKNQWDRTTAVVLAVGGLVAIYLGWEGLRTKVLAAEQIPYLASGAVLGLFLLGAAATLWLSADMRDEWRMLRDIHRTMQDERDEAEAVAASSQDEPADLNPVRNGRKPLRASSGR